MSWMDRLLGGVREQYIARPPEATGTLIYRHPNQNIPRGAKLTVRSDERALFFKHGRLAGALHAGEHVIDDGVIPFLDALIVRPITGGDHFVSEIFFVREAEHIHNVPQRDLGTFNDVGSRLVVTVRFNARFAVRVEDGVSLITTLAGQGADASQRVAEFLDSRIRSLLRAAIGQLLSTMPVLQVVSNQHGEMIGQHVQGLAASEFRANGLVFSRFLDLELALDEDSIDALRNFGSAQAELNIQREGVSLAAQPGFANYHLVQGQRAALEGLGEGLSTGRMGPMLGMGLGGGFAAMPALAVPSLAVPTMPVGLPTVTSTLDVRAPRAPGVLETAWHLRTERGLEGPFTALQLATRLASEPMDPGSREVQAAGSGVWQRVADIPELFSLVVRSSGPVASPSLPRPAVSFESILREVIAGGAPTVADMDRLVLALAREQPDADMATLREQVARRLRVRGLTVPS